MKKFNVVLLLFIIISLIGCSNYKNKSGVISINSSFIEVSIYDYSLEKCEKAYDYIEETFRKISKLCDYETTYEGLNNIYTVNNTDGDVIVDELLYNLLEEAVEYQNLTDGLYCPFMGNINSIYNSLLSMNIGNISLAKIPSDSFLSAEIDNAESTKVIFNKQDLSIRKVGTGKIDITDIANSYALRLSKNYLKDNGIYTYFINVDLSNVSLGNKHNSSYYSVGVRNVDSLNLKVKNKDISSSSMLENNFIYYGKRYHKYISSITGKPENMYDICVVIDNDPIRASIFSKIFTFLETDEYEKYYINYNFDVLVFKDNEIIYQTKKENIYG